MYNVLISTWVGNTSLNYGSLLQATALQWSIKRLCPDVLPITLNVSRWSNTNPFWAEVERINRFGIRYEVTRIRFLRWCHRNMNMSPMCRDEKRIVNYSREYADILLTGSDTVWFSEHIRPVFMWDYPELSDKPAIAYSVSMRGDKELEYDNKDALNHFINISVRETISKDIIEKEYRGKAVCVTLDPTLLIAREEWKKKAAKRLISEPYILCYLLDAPEKYRLALAEIKKNHPECRIVYIDTNYIDKFEYANYDYRDMNEKRVVGPREFLSLVKYAEFICTDGFHGTCFSILFNRPFVVFNHVNNTNGNRDRRIPDLLKRLELETQLFMLEKDSATYWNVDWTKVNALIEKERETSERYLRDSILFGIASLSNKSICD